MVAIPDRTYDLIGPGWQQGHYYLAQCQYPKYYNGMETVPLEGKSLAPTETPNWSILCRPLGVSCEPEAPP